METVRTPSETLEKNHASVTQMAQQLTLISSLNIFYYVILIPVLFGRLDPNCMSRIFSPMLYSDLNHFVGLLHKH